MMPLSKDSYLLQTTGSPLFCMLFSFVVYVVAYLSLSLRKPCSAMVSSTVSVWMGLCKAHCEVHNVPFWLMLHYDALWACRLTYLRNYLEHSFVFQWLKRSQRYISVCLDVGCCCGLVTLKAAVLKLLCNFQPFSAVSVNCPLISVQYLSVTVLLPSFRRVETHHKL